MDQMWRTQRDGMRCGRCETWKSNFFSTKRETKKDFSDHTEKAETSAVGRALAMLGYGTQFAISDLDEGDRIVDSPVLDTRGAASSSSAASSAAVSAPSG